MKFVEVLGSLPESVQNPHRGVPAFKYIWRFDSRVDQRACLVNNVEMHLTPLIRDLAVILFVAGVVSLIFQKMKQPVVLGYLIAGIIVGPYTGSPLVQDIPNIRTWGDLGVIFLMFTLGLEFSFRKLAKVGFGAIFIAVFEVTFMFVSGFLLGRLSGWSPKASLLLGSVISISSTTILIKSLEELNLKTRRFAELIFAILIVEDLIAILMLAAFTSLTTGDQMGLMGMLGAAGRLILFAGTWFLVGYFILPRFMKVAGRMGSDEMLMILALGFCLCLAVLASMFNYSVALGAFIMGSILAESTESRRIEELMKPLRDLFAAVFFVSVGMLLDPHAVWEHLGLIALISIIVIVGKTAAITIGSLLTGSTLKTAIQAGFGMAQFGEFSFIMAGFGAALDGNHKLLYAVAVSVSLLTTFTTPYMIRVSHRVATWVTPRLPHRFVAILSQYSSWHDRKRYGDRRKTENMAVSIRWVLNGILVASICLVVSYGYQHWFDDLLKDQNKPLMDALAYLLALLGSAPFLWGMAAPREKGRPFIVILRMATLLWISFLGGLFFSWKLALGSVFFSTTVFVIFFHRKLEATYRWIESIFLATFEAHPKSNRHQDPFQKLTPWDVHLVRVKVHPNSDLAGKKIEQIQLRKRHGINIVVIQRGNKALVAPEKDQFIYPKDELLLLGSDEQIELVRALIETPTDAMGLIPHSAGYELKRLDVTLDSGFAHKSILETGIREKFGAMVVGVERGNQRLLNPEAQFILELNDAIWLVGETQKLEQLIKSALKYQLHPSQM